jgi:hypothetical protein
MLEQRAQHDAVVANEGAAVQKHGQRRHKSYPPAQVRQHSLSPVAPVNYRTLAHARQCDAVVSRLAHARGDAPASHGTQDGA